jgi:hypothetical protein
MSRGIFTPINYINHLAFDRKVSPNRLLLLAHDCKSNPIMPFNSG